MEIKLAQFYADNQHEHEKYEFFEILRCLVGYHHYDTRTKITGELQFLLDYGKIIKLVAFLDRNYFNSKVLQLQANFPSKIKSS